MLREGPIDARLTLLAEALEERLLEKGDQQPSQQLVDETLQLVMYLRSAAALQPDATIQPLERCKVGGCGVTERF